MMEEFGRRQTGVSRTAKKLRACPLVLLAAALVVSPAAQNQTRTGTHALPFFPSGSDTVRQGFARVINHSTRAGRVTIEAFDDAGQRYGPLTLEVKAGETVHFNSGDLEDGNATKGLDAGTGGGQGDWRLSLTSELDIEVLGYMRTADGFLTAMHDVVPRMDDGRHWVPIFNPGSNADQVSLLRLSNPGDAAVEVSIEGIDGESESPGTTVTLTIPAAESRTYSSAELESGTGAGLQGSLGDGAGKWQLYVESEGEIVAMSLLSSPTGHLTNLSTAPDNEDDGVHSVALFPSASDADGRQGFVRVINRSDAGGEVTIEAYDDSTWVYEPLTLAIGANETVHFNSDDLELGNAGKGLSGSTGTGQGDWCLELTSELDIRVLSYVRTPDGFLTAMHDSVPSADARHRVVIFNPASNVDQKSLLRLVNPGDEEATAGITGKDGPGDFPGGEVRIAVPAVSSRTVTAGELESGDGVAEGALGDGAGKWRLTVETETPLIVMSLLESPTGHLTNLSTAPTRGAGAPPGPDLTVTEMSVTGSSGGTYPGGDLTLSAVVGNPGEAASAATTLRYYRSADSMIDSSDAEVATDAVDQLEASGTSTESVDVTAPSATGTYYYGACADAVSDERVTTNNCSAGVSVTVLEPPQVPDLEVGTPTASDSSPATGASFTLSATVTNAGNAGSAATTLRYYRSTNATISSADTQVGTDAVGALSASGTSAESISVTAPSTAGAYYYGACVDSVTGESDTTNNCSAGVSVTVLEPPQVPDLEVGTPTASDSSPATGASFTLSATVTNAGNAGSAATTLRYYRSADATISSADTQVGTDAVRALAAAGTSAESVSLTAPATAGAYYYGACVDSVSGESDTTNNCSSSVKVDVAEPEAPDLEVGTPTASDASPETGASFTLSATVTNAGNAGSAATTLRYYRSSDATISSADTQVGTDAVRALAAAGTSAESVSLTAPATAGTYYYGACVDSVTGESDTTDNCSGSVQVDASEPPTTKPDLTVTLSFTVPDGGIVAGRPFRVGARVDNVGEAASDATTLRYYVSKDAPVRTSETEVGTDAVEGLASGRAATKSVELTAPSTPGSYYYNACVDGVEGESDTANNCSFVSIGFTIRAPAPNLVVESPSVSDASPETGASFTLSATVKNAGEAESAATTLRYYRSADVSITSSDIEVGTDAVEGLAESGTSAESIELTAPDTAGTYYYGACVDSVTGESDTTDNCSSSSSSVQVEVEEPEYPDLEVGTPTVSDSSPETGASFTLSATVTNAGNAASAATTLRYYRSADTTIGTADTQVGTHAVGALSASGTSAESVSLTALATAGAYYYGACVDSVSGESDTTNNCSSSVKVDVEEPAPQAASVEVTAPQEWAPVGGTVSYTARVLDSEGEEVSGYTISWTSSDTAKATVDSSGVVTALAVGEATITALASATASAAVKALPLGRDFGSAAANSQSPLSGSLKMDVVKPVARIEFSPSSLSFDAVDVWETVTATLYDADDNEMSPTYWGWGSADEEVAMVHSRLGTGVSASVQSIGEGTTTGRLSANGTSASFNVTVTLPAARVDISPRSLTFEALGDTESVTVRVLDENGDEVEDATFSYSAVSSPCCGPDVDRTDPWVFDMETTGDGLDITSEGPGSGQITISSPDVESAILPVTVYMKPASLEVSPSSASLAVDGTTTLTATVEDANGNSIHVNQGDGRGGLAVYWETSDDEVATVVGNTAREDHNTGGTATVTGVGAGSVTVTGRHGSSVTGTSSVTVTD